jgi:hypothetical protein
MLATIFGLLYQLLMMDGDECGAVGVIIGGGYRNTRRKDAPVPIYSPQIPHDLTCSRKRGDG